MMTSSVPTHRRRGVVLVNEERLARLLSLPEHWRVIGFRTYPERLSIGVHVEGPDLPEVAPGCEASIVDPDLFPPA